MNQLNVRRCLSAVTLLLTVPFVSLLNTASNAEFDGAMMVEEVVVTGSRIARSDLEGVAPVTVYTSVDIDRSGATSIGQLLRELPSVSGGAQTT